MCKACVTRLVFLPEAVSQCHRGHCKAWISLCFVQEIEGMMAIVAKGDALSPADLQKVMDGEL